MEFNCDLLELFWDLNGILMGFSDFPWIFKMVAGSKWAIQTTLVDWLTRDY